MRLHWGFDSLSLRDERVFGWGWLLAAHSPATRIDLILMAGKREVGRLRCQQAGTRQDLVEVFPEIRHAGGAGFLVQGRLPKRHVISGAELHVRFADGGTQVISLPGFPERYLPGHLGGRWRGRWAILSQLLRHAQWRALGRRAIDLFRRRWHAWRRRGTPGSITAPLPRNSLVVFDHDMGGGANHFRKEKVAGWISSGREVLLVTPHLPTLSYDLTRTDANGEKVARFHNLSACLSALPSCGEVVINSLVSYDDPGLVLDWVQTQRASGSRIRFYLHDYHAACPVWTLVDDTGRYCGIPDISRCEQCLAENQAPFLSLMPSLDLVAWRDQWRAVLRGADRIIAFSQASVSVLTKAFPDLKGQRVEVRPHNTDFIRPDPVAFDLGLPLKLGIVGSINLDKGAAIVAEMVRLIEDERLPIRIVVVGTLDNAPSSDILRITGPYRRQDLPSVLRKERIALCLLPSVCQETFSYVTAELMAHRMPLAVFDLGAPAERVRGYALGRIIQGVSARSALDAVLKFHEDLLELESKARHVKHAGSP